METLNFQESVAPCYPKGIAYKPWQRLMKRNPPLITRKQAGDKVPLQDGSGKFLDRAERELIISFIIEGAEMQRREDIKYYEREGNRYEFMGC